MVHKILAAIDRSPTGEAVFDAALGLTKISGASLMLLHVLSNQEKDSPQMPTLTTRESYPMGGELLEVYQKQWQTYEEQGLKLLRSYTDIAAKAGVSNEFTQNAGNPSREICAVARTWDADLIVIGRRSHSGLSEMVMGSVSNYVFHHTPCSIYVVHASALLTAEVSVVSQV